MAFTFFMRSSPSVRLRRDARACGPSPIGLAVVFPVYGVADVVALVLYFPVAAGIPVHVGGGHLSCFPAGESEGVFLADAAAGDLVYLSRSLAWLACGIDSFCAGDPAGPLLDPAAAAFLHVVVRGFAGAGVLIVTCLCGSAVFPCPSSGFPSVSRRRISQFPAGCARRRGCPGLLLSPGFPLRSGGVRLGVLVGAVGYPELRYRDSLAVGIAGQRVLVFSSSMHRALPSRRPRFPLVVPAFPGLRGLARFLSSSAASIRSLAPFVVCSVLVRPVLLAPSSSRWLSAVPLPVLPLLLAPAAADPRLFPPALPPRAVRSPLSSVLAPSARLSSPTSPRCRPRPHTRYACRKDAKTGAGPHARFTASPCV